MSGLEKLNKLFAGDKKLFSVFLTAGYPNLSDTLPLCKMLEEEGVDFLELGIPYSDPMADGPVIQESSEVALENGMSLERLFSDLKSLRNSVQIPIFLMGYFNPVLQYGVERFLNDAKEVGVNGCIIPDLPLPEYRAKYQPLFEKARLAFVPLITPTTPKKRFPEIEESATTFIYAVSSTAVTGGSASTARREDYFQDLKKLSKPVIVGFGISTREDFVTATSTTIGAIIGSAFIRALEKDDPIESGRKFVQKIMNK